MNNVIKNNTDVLVVLDDKQGYVIRLQNYHGATFTINEDLSVTIGQSSRMTYSEETWNLINNEISEGKVYMSTLVEKGGIEQAIVKPKYISSKDIKPNTVYENEKCQIVFFVGEGYFRNGFGNRSGCRYLVGKFNANSVIRFYQDNDSIVIEYDDERTYCNIDHYTTKPTKLVRELDSFPANIDHIKMVSKSGKVVREFHISRC